MDISLFRAEGMHGNNKSVFLRLLSGDFAEWGCNRTGSLRRAGAVSDKIRRTEREYVEV
jgi:hypothetical protein